MSSYVDKRVSLQTELFSFCPYNITLYKVLFSNREYINLILLDRSLKSYSKLKVDKMEFKYKDTLAVHLVSMLDKLCSAEDDDTDATTLDAEQTKVTVVY